MSTVSPVELNTAMIGWSPGELPAGAGSSGPGMSVAIAESLPWATGEGNARRAPAPRSTDPTGQARDARDQLAWIHRLGHVEVEAGHETADSVLRPAVGGQGDRGGLAALAGLERAHLANQGVRRRRPRARPGCNRARSRRSRDWPASAA